MKPAYMAKLFDFVSKLLDLVILKIEEKCCEVQGSGCVGLSFVFDASGSTLCAFHCLNSCPLFSLPKERNNFNYELLEPIIQSIESILVALAKLFVIISNCARNTISGICMQGLPLSPSTSFQEFSPMSGCGMQIVDMDLDVDGGSKNVDFLSASGNNKLVSSSPLQLKLKLVSVISTFFSVSPLLTWQTLFDMIERETDDKVMHIFYDIYKHLVCIQLLFFFSLCSC